MPATVSPIVWTNRIVAEGDADPATLVPNPRNWRTHPKSQQAAIDGSLTELGWLARVLVNRRTGRLIDGHLRVERALATRQPTVPVSYVDLDEAEEALALATYDPISAMAGADAALLDAVLKDVTTTDAALSELIESIRTAVTYPADAEWGDAMTALPDGDKSGFESMSFILTPVQAGYVRAALHAAMTHGPFIDTGNANSNGNALARVCEAYCG